MTFSNVHQMVCDDLLVSDHENHCSVDRCSRSEEGLSRPSPQSLHGKRVEQAWLGGEGTMPCTGTGEGGKRPGQISTQPPCMSVAGILKQVPLRPPLPTPTSSHLWRGRSQSHQGSGPHWGKPSRWVAAHPGIPAGTSGANMASRPGLTCVLADHLSLSYPGVQDGLHRGRP